MTFAGPGSATGAGLATGLAGKRTRPESIFGTQRPAAIRIGRRFAQTRRALLRRYGAGQIPVGPSGPRSIAICVRVCPKPAASVGGVRGRSRKSHALARDRVPGCNTRALTSSTFRRPTLRTSAIALLRRSVRRAECAQQRDPPHATPRTSTYRTGRCHRPNCHDRRHPTSTLRQMKAFPPGNRHLSGDRRPCASPNCRRLMSRRDRVRGLAGRHRPRLHRDTGGRKADRRPARSKRLPDARRSPRRKGRRKATAQAAIGGI